MKYLFAAILAVFLSCSFAEASCIVQGTVQTCDWLLDWQWNGDASQTTGFRAERQAPNGTWFTAIPNIPIEWRQATETIANDPGETQQCYRLFAFNQVGDSLPSNIACDKSPFIDVVTLKTNSIVTVSHRNQDKSTIIALLINKDLVIGPGGLEIVYPSRYTLSVSRRSGNKSSVIAILVNKSTNVIVTAP